MINPEGIKTQKFGLEVECTGLTRAKAAKAIGEYFGKTPVHTGGFYDKYEVTDDKNRRWTVMSDASIKCQLKNGDAASKSDSVEFVTPVCEYEDIPHIQEIVRRIRKAGGICNSSTGVHIHINAAPYDAKKLRNLVNIVASKEEMIYKAFKVDEYRKGYCEKTDPEFIDRLNKRKPTSMETLKKLWYNGYDGSGERYHNSRYHLLNLHSVFQKGTVEWRCFNSTLHSGVLRAYLSFCLAISNQALQQKSSQFHVTYIAKEENILDWKWEIE